MNENTLKEKKIIHSKLKNAKVSYRNIILGRAVDIFLEIFDGDYYSIKDTSEDIKDFIEKHNFPNDRPLVFGDLSYLSTLHQTFLLKFIEEAPVPIIALASKDNLSPVLMSRFLNFVKLPELVQGNKYNLKDFIKYKMDCELKQADFDVESEALRLCPEYLAMINNDGISKYISGEVRDLCIMILKDYEVDLY